MNMQTGAPSDKRFTVALMSPREAGLHLGIPTGTVKGWIKEPATDQHPLMHTVAPEVLHGPRLPFIAVAEAQILRELRNTGLSMQHIRAGVARLRADTGDEYVLATHHIASDGGELLYRAADAVAPEWLRARDNQISLRGVVDQLLRFVSYASDGYASRLRLKPYTGAEVILDPRFGFGIPVLGRSKVRVDAVADLFFAGESVETVASEFDVTTEEVQAVIRVLGQKRAA